jgi:hypothetical protein
MARKKKEVLSPTQQAIRDREQRTREAAKGETTETTSKEASNE